MANTYVDYIASGGQTDFAFSFPYLEDEHVTVEIDGITTTEFSIVTSPATKVVLTSGATASQVVRVRRKSQPDTNLVDFINGSILTESELDRAYLHNRYLNEEISELNDASLQIWVDSLGQEYWNARNLQIKNVAAPTDGQDAVNKLYLDGVASSILTGTGTPPSFDKFTGTGSQTTFSLSFTTNGIASTGILVAVDGAVIDPDDYTISGGADEVEFTTPPALNSEILVIERGFKVKTEIPTEYDWGGIVGDPVTANYSYGQI